MNGDAVIQAGGARVILAALRRRMQQRILLPAFAVLSHLTLNHATHADVREALPLVIAGLALPQQQNTRIYTHACEIIGNLLASQEQNGSQALPQADLEKII